MNKWEVIYSTQNANMFTKQLLFISFCSVTSLPTSYSNGTYAVYTSAYLLPAAYASAIFLQVQEGQKEKTFILMAAS